MPVAPVAGFSPDQLAAFAATNNAQGMAQPFINAGAGYLNQSAQPISAQQVANYYNPMAANVTAQMQNIFGEQQAQNTGSLTQTAGGVGSDRIAVGQADLANQQSLAAGQTYSGLYQQALQAAQQQQQMAAGAGYGLGQLGPAAEAAQLQGISAQLGTGGLQQQLAQAQLNAPYQQQLAQIAYPFQTAQYLAGVTGGLAGALGGTTTGQATTTYPSPSALAQALGAGTSLLGLTGAAKGSFGGSSPISAGLQGLQSIGAPAGQSYSGSTPYIGAGYTAPGTTYIGGSAYPTFAEGGATDTESNYGNLDQTMRVRELSGLLPQAQAGNPLAQDIVSNLPGYDDGGSVNISTQPMGPPSIPFPGASVPAIGGATAIPQTQMQPSMGRSMGQFGQYMFMQEPHLPSGGGTSGTSGASGSNTIGGSNTVQDITAGTNMAMQLLPLLAAAAKRGGGIHAEGGAVNPMSAGQGFDDGGDVGDAELATLAAQPANSDFYAGTWNPNNPNAGYNPNKPAADPTVSGDPGVIAQLQATASGTPAAAAPMAPTAAVPYTNVTGLPAQAPPPMRPVMQRPPQPQAAPIAPMGAQAMPQYQTPYPDALQTNAAQQMSQSPWMALVRAGAAMASTTGPIGTVLAKGINAGANELDAQRKDLESEEGINLKAQQLYEEAMDHQRKYNQMTPYESSELGVREKELALRAQAMGQLPGGSIAAIQRSVYSDPVWSTQPAEAQNAEIERRIEQAAAARRGAGAGAAAQPGAGTLQNPIPFVQGQTKRQQGLYYQLPTGEVRQATVNDQ